MTLLRGVIDPELGSDIVDLGMAKGVEVDPDGAVRVTVALTTAGCPLRAQIQKDVKARVAGMPGVASVKITWTELTADEKAATMARARWNAREDAPDTTVPATTRVVAVIQGSRRRSDAGTPSREPRIPVVGYAKQDGWALLSNGSLAIVRGGAYRVEVVSPDGRRVAGPPYAGRPRPVTDDDKRRFVIDFMASSPTSGRGADGGMGHSPAVDDAAVTRFVRSTEFAEEHPWFQGAPIPSPGGRVWVRRAGPADAPALYDVFGGDGRRVHTVALPPGRRVLAVGVRGVYAAHADELGLESVERYRLPPDAIPTSGPTPSAPAASSAAHPSTATPGATPPRVSLRSTAPTRSSFIPGATSGR